MLGPNGPEFPLNYAALFSAAAVLLAVASAMFIMVREPAPRQAPQPGTFRQHLGRGAEILRQDSNYRQLVLVRALVGAVAVGQVVFIPFAIKGLGLPESIVGELMIFAALASLPANFLWSHLGDRHGNRLLIRAAAASAVTAPAIALASAYLPRWPLASWIPGGYDMPAAAFVLAFVLGSAGMRGCMMGSTNYLLETAPDQRRPSYMAFMRVLQAPSSLLAPIIGGMVAQWVSFQAAFALGCIAAAASWMLAGRLVEPRNAAAAPMASDR
jgi:hypothetical protein